MDILIPPPAYPFNGTLTQTFFENAWNYEFVERLNQMGLGPDTVFCIRKATSSSNYSYEAYIKGFDCMQRAWHGGLNCWDNHLPLTTEEVKLL